MQIATADAVDYFRGVKGLAVAIGLTERTVSKWGEYVPDRWARRVYLASGERIPANHARRGRK